MKTSITFLKYKNSIKDTIMEIEKTDADYIHVDVMDGNFVPNTFLTLDEIKEELKNTIKPLDVHLMTENPYPYIEVFENLNTEFISVHAEINKDIDDVINFIHSKGIKAGLAINPETTIDEIKPFLNNLEYIIIMGVTPGEGGQKLMLETLNKIPELINLRNTYNYHYMITLDGGVNNETRKHLNDLDVLTIGSYVSMSDNFQERINQMR